MTMCALSWSGHCGAHACERAPRGFRGEWTWRDVAYRAAAQRPCVAVSVYDYVDLYCTLDLAHLHPARALQLTYVCAEGWPRVGQVHPCTGGAP